MENAKPKERPSLDIVRTYPAAPEKIWRAWTDPQALKQWWNQVGNPDWRSEIEFTQGSVFEEPARGGWIGALDRTVRRLQESLLVSLRRNHALR